MTNDDWEYLADTLLEVGLVAGRPPATGVQFHEHLGAANGVEPDEALAWLANAFHMVPMGVPSPSCSSRAEVTFRRFATDLGQPEPWLPFGTLGPLLICAHYNPASEAMWGIPTEFVVPVVIPQNGYQPLLADVRDRLAMKPLQRHEPHVFSHSPPHHEGLDHLLEWLIEEYPLNRLESRQRIAAERDRLLEESGGSEAALVGLSRGLGLALHFLATREPCGNAEMAPVQSVFPEALLEKHAVYPLHCTRRVVYLLTADRKNYAFEDEWFSGGNEAFEFRHVLAEREAILRTIQRGRERASKGAVTVVESDFVDSAAEHVVEIDPEECLRLNPSSVNATPEQVVHWVLHRAITGRASDLHIERYYNAARFRLRIDGELRTVHTSPEELLPRFVSIVKNWANMGQHRQTLEDGRFAIRLGKRRIDGRVSAVPCRNGLQKITVRFLDKQGGIRSLDELNLTPRQLSIFRRTMGREQGLVLITGPTGSGKTTTLYALLNSVNSENRNIHTVEDPIEYAIEGINQTQTDPTHGVTFADGLRGLMRADPDVLLIGECRDAETAMAAVTASLTGHLVLTTMHANDSLRAVSRFVSMGIPAYLLADALVLSQAQRLVRRLCTFCRQPVEIDRSLRALLQAQEVDIPPEVECHYVPRGCPECGESGYNGRMALMELCPIDAEIGEIIVACAPQNQLREAAARKGFRSLYQQALEQVLAGHTSAKEVAFLNYAAMLDDETGLDAPAGDGP